MTTMKHTDDDGDLSVFAAGDQILFACTGGHFWVIDAKQQEVPRKSKGSKGRRAQALGDLVGLGDAEVILGRRTQD